MPPLPKKNVRRRNARPDWVHLPATGRKGRTPAWPSVLAKPEGWQKKWKYLWSTPQAVAWEHMGIDHVLARYVVLLLLAEQPQVTAAIFAEIRQMEDKLGLSPRGLRALQWEIETEVEASSGERGEGGSSDEEDLDYA